MWQMWADISVEPHTPTKLHDVISHKRAIFMVTNRRASNLTLHTNIAIRNTRNATANRNPSHGISVSLFYVLHGRMLTLSYRLTDTQYPNKSDTQRRNAMIINSA